MSNGHSLIFQFVQMDQSDQEGASVTIERILDNLTWYFDQISIQHLKKEVKLGIIHSEEIRRKSRLLSGIAQIS